ncbi:hypothetical protein DICVIV_07931 [Dictyocaulus viviparus]|uniref:PH domain-containing protein n=1 Tax=Dictyocaulus viviparus TaxID=29172 RepID=A0A0D8XMZ3_DICVI|nr:hypothetical protein DICVIV_07931 [Dictyocaulus viviparus]
MSFHGRDEVVKRIFYVFSYLFLFDFGILFCKKRNLTNHSSSMDSEYYEHKMCIPISSLGFSELSRSGSSRFELWDETKSDAYAVETCDVEQRSRWIARLSHIVHRDGQHMRQRPRSWTSTISNDSVCSTGTRSSDNEVLTDTNGNSETAPVFTSSACSHSENIATDGDVSLVTVAPITESHLSE